ncbi:hypothetical protein, partial [Pseudomonas syringae group genomosp. 7]|uniref:hypothetical protein n=1 Tax=Pseudomonas syringae group genomosp. 7 TaxID=251699 RepID=UPI00376FFC1D
LCVGGLCWGGVVGGVVRWGIFGVGALRGLSVLGMFGGLFGVAGVRVWVFRFVELILGLLDEAVLLLFVGVLGVVFPLRVLVALWVVWG